MLEHFFGSKTRLKLLKIFFRSPERAFYVRELARLCDTQLHAVRRELANLESLQIVALVATAGSTPSEVGTERSKFYQLQADASLFQELRALLLKGEMLEEQRLTSAIKERAGDIKLFIMTGLFTGAPDVGSDILLVGRIKPVVVARLVRDYETSVNREVRYTIMDEREFKDRREIGDKFLYTIFESKHEVLVDQYRLA